MERNKMDEATIERFRTENSNLRRENNKLKERIKQLEKEKSEQPEYVLNKNISSTNKASIEF